MTEEHIEPVDSTLDDQEAGEQDILDVSDDEQDTEVLRQQAKDLADKNRQLFARAKKAEGFVQQDGKWVKPAPKPPVQEAALKQPEAQDITSRDTIAIINAKVHEDDVADVVSYAKFKGISVADVLKDDVMKTTLANKAEQRKTANATNTGPARPGSSTRSGESMLEKANSTGELPESDKDMEALAKARLARKP